MTQPPSLLCIGLTTVDVVALPVRIEPFDGVRLIDAVQMAPAGTAAGTALVAAKLRVATQLAGAVGADAAGRFIRGELDCLGRQQPRSLMMPMPPMHASPIIDDDVWPEIADQIHHIIQHLIAPDLLRFFRSL